jgi:hypothetical protein
MNAPAEVLDQAGRIGHDVGAAQQCRGDAPGLRYRPVRAHPAHVAAESARAGVQRGPQFLGRLVLVPSVREQDPVPDVHVGGVQQTVGEP